MGKVRDAGYVQSLTVARSNAYINTREQNILAGATQRGAADTEIKVPSGENTELKRSPFKAWSR